MPTNRKLLGAAAFSLALAGGGVAGAVLGTPNPSGAQDSTEDTSTAAAPADPGGGFLGHRGDSLAAAAEAIGISEDELRTALEDGQSIAQVAEAEGVDVQIVIDALVADATERLEAAIDGLPDRMAEVVEREGLPDRGGPGGPGGSVAAARVWRRPRTPSASASTSSAPRCATARRSPRWQPRTTWTCRP